MARRCAVLGSPIGHSLSPTLHRAAYAMMGLDWTYDAVELDAAALGGWLDGLSDEWRGLSLTMPLKEAAVPLCTTVSATAELVGAVNTLLLDGRSTRLGENTDVTGFVGAWRAAGITGIESALVVGAGATARSAAAALASVGVRRVVVLARAPERAGRLMALLERLELAREVRSLTDPAAPPAADLLVSTIPGEAAVGLSELADRVVDAVSAVCDVAYSPRRTPFVAAAERAGLPRAAGFDLLLHQAVGQVELMTGESDVPVETMRQAGLVEMVRREEAT